MDEKVENIEQRFIEHLDKKATDVVRPHGMGSIASKNYETGIFTPYLIGPEGLQYLSEGHYVKIDRLVSYSLKLIVTNKPPGPFALILHGLPYVISSADAVGSIKVKNMSSHFTNFTPVTQSGETAVRITSLIVSGEEISHEGIYESAVYANSELIITGMYYTN
ncbi:hypothetical protein A0U40_00655 [[Bacillus] sp. KCTC 13219]|nr:hypothetical protein A0U40_00655 [[Bacillus] sp. KCTC 13219]